MDSVYAWDKDGNSLPGFPIGPVYAVDNQVTIADIDGDGNLELIFDDNVVDSTNNGRYHAYRNNGTIEPGWPILTPGKTTFMYQPCLFDISRNGILDILGGARNIAGATTDIYLWSLNAPYNHSKIMNPMWQFNARHNGVFGDYDSIIGIKPISSQIQKQFSLNQNYPNPFNPTTKIRFSLPMAIQNVRLIIYDILGREVATLVNQTLQPGTYEVDWNETNYSSGVYFYKLTAGNFTDVKKMILMK